MAHLPLLLIHFTFLTNTFIVVLPQHIMATSKNPTQLIKLAEPSDLTVEIIERKASGHLAEKRSTILVSKAKLVEFSEYFRRMFMPGNRWAESNSNTITLEGDNLKSMEVWFRLCHGKLSDLPENTVSIGAIWHVILVGDKYEFDRKYLAAWFEKWHLWIMGKISQQTNPELRMNLRRQLLFPCYSFNHGVEFQKLTKFFAYEYHGHIEELNPTRHLQMHLPKRVIRMFHIRKWIP
jgi:hypothetical protein